MSLDWNLQGMIVHYDGGITPFESTRAVLCARILHFPSAKVMEYVMLGKKKRGGLIEVDYHVPTAWTHITSNQQDCSQITVYACRILKATSSLVPI
jgi:hypothetical protein